MKTILDVSSVIYGGHAGASSWRVHGFPVGGVRKLFGIINAGLSSSDFALCFDGGNIIKKELLPTYKAGRVPDYSVLAQVDLAKELLTACNIGYYHDSKYEADDFVYSVCRELSLLGDTDEVNIYTDDRDISCCVTDLISIRNVTSNGICITRQSFEERVVRERTIPYNTILLWKIFHGDPSDNYKALHIPGLTFDVVANDFVDLIGSQIGPDALPDTAFADFELFKVIIAKYDGLITKEQLRTLEIQGRVAYPYCVPVSNVGMDEYARGLARGELLYSLQRKHMKFFGNGSFDRRKFEFYCSLLGLNKARNIPHVDKDSAEAQEFFTLLDMRARELSSGALAVRYHRRKHQDSNGGTIQNMSLPV